MVGLLFVAALATLLVQYRLDDQAVGTEFFRAHKTISHTGELLQRGMWVGATVLTLLVVAVAIWALRLTHRIVRPVHTLHRALDELVTGDLGVRLELHRHDEFQEVGDALNRLADEFGTTLGAVHSLVDQIEAIAERTARGADDDSAERQLHRLAQELNRAMDFFRLEPRRLIREDAS
jgi:methyl-accepting chemotaxis protein